MASRRQRRVAELIHQQLSNIIQFGTKDPRIGFVTLTEVTVTPDLKTATVYVSLLSIEGDDEKEVLAGLGSATPFFRQELGRKVQLRHIPELIFRLDQSLAYAEKINSLLAEIEIPPEPEEHTEADDPSTK